MRTEVDSRTTRRLERLLAEARTYLPTQPPWPPVAATAPGVNAILSGRWLTRPVESTATALVTISKENPWIRAFVVTLPETAMEHARQLEEQPSSSPVYGMPVAVKDLFDVAGTPTLAGSNVPDRTKAKADSLLVQRLEARGAVIVGKTATHEFAFGVSGEPVRNPRAPERIPGGSSSGSAAAVAAGMVPAALGTDTAGSVRIPAACCGVVGLKPTHGILPKEGIMPLSWSLDHPGILARTVTEAAWVLGALAQMPTARPGVTRIGVPANWDGAIPPQETLYRLKALGLTITTVTLPDLTLLHHISRVIILAEAAAYHAPWLEQRAQLYTPDVRDRLELGLLVPAKAYINAQRLRTEVIRQLDAVLQQVDAIATPTLPAPPPERGEKADHLIQFVGPFNVTGHPAISVPCGPLTGLQLVGRRGDDATLLRLAASFERGEPQWAK